MNDVNYLIVSTTIDYSTDLICYELERRSKSYLRINRDCFSKYNIQLDINKKELYITVNSILYKITERSLKTVYFRAPVFYRNFKNYTIDEQLYRSQWSAFIRNLQLFDNAKWINFPTNTYKAENKMLQLSIAREIGFDIPKTFLSNTVPDNIDIEESYIVKSLDTALFYDGKKEYFTYSTIVSGNELFESNLVQAPVIIQQYIEDKIDLRATVIDNQIFCVSITENNNSIVGDWRKNPKEKLSYSKIDLPNDICDKIIKLMNKLQLNFGGIDFALVNDKYYFIEINPTGEWGWLVRSANLPIDKAIVDSIVDRK